MNLVVEILYYVTAFAAALLWLKSASARLLSEATWPTYLNIRLLLTSADRVIGARL
jgi:hypothetical protein